MYEIRAADKFRERVVLENTLPTELEKRCRDERVHKIINTKIQNLKRKRLNFWLTVQTHTH